MHAARPNLVASEGAFGTHLLHHDLSSESLMFGSDWAVVVEQSGIGSAPGLGLEVRSGDLVTLCDAGLDPMRLWLGTCVRAGRMLYGRRDPVRWISWHGLFYLLAEL